MFYALVMTVKRLVDELFMHFFKTFVSFWELAPRSLDPAGDGSPTPYPLICPLLEKNPAGAHVNTYIQ